MKVYNMDNPEIKETVLQKMFVEVNKYFTEETQYKYLIGNEPKFGHFVMDNMNAMCWNLHSWVWAKKPDRLEVITGSTTYPDGWFQFLKWEIYSRLIRYRKLEYIATKLFEPRLKHVEIKRTIELQTFYPTLKLMNHDPYIRIAELDNSGKGWYQDE